MEKSCKSCRWGGANDAINGLFPGDIICVCDKSEKCADYVDAGYCCGYWEAEVQQ